MKNEYDWDTAPDAVGNALDRATAAVDIGARRVKNLLRSSINAVCLVAIVALEILHRFVVYGFNSEFAIDYIFSAVIASLASLLAFYVFFPNGKSAGRAREAYRKVMRQLDCAREKIKSQALLARFRAYCKEKTDSRVCEIREGRLDDLENLYVSREAFEEYKKLSYPRLLLLFLRGEYSFAAWRQILLCRKRIKRYPLSPAYFMSGAVGEQEALYRRDTYEQRTLALRPVFCIAVGVFTSIITWAPKEIGSPLDVFLSIAISVFQICLAAFSGYSSGVTAAEREQVREGAKTTFIDEFLEGEKENECDGK